MDRKFYFFDLDGTLADTDCDIRIAWKAALKALGLESPDFDAKFVTGPPIDEVVKLLFPDKYCPELIADARREFGRAYDASGFPNTPEYPGVLDRVRQLKANGARVFIVTNKRYVGAKLMAAKFGWDRIFEAVYAGDMFVTEGLGVWKFGSLEVDGMPERPNAQTSKRPNVQTPKRPNVKLRKPELLARVMAELGAKPEECVMVGDTVSDFEAAQKNGITSVAVAWGYGTQEELAMADRVVRSPEEI